MKNPILFTILLLGSPALAASAPQAMIKEMRLSRASAEGKKIIADRSKAAKGISFVDPNGLYVDVSANVDSAVNTVAVLKTELATDGHLNVESFLIPSSSRKVISATPEVRKVSLEGGAYGNARPYQSVDAKLGDVKVVDVEGITRTYRSIGGHTIKEFQRFWIKDGRLFNDFQIISNKDREITIMLHDSTVIPSISFNMRSLKGAKEELFADKFYLPTELGKADIQLIRASDDGSTVTVWVTNDGHTNKLVYGLRPSARGEGKVSAELIHTQYNVNLGPAFDKLPKRYSLPPRREIVQGDSLGSIENSLSAK